MSILNLLLVLSAADPTDGLAKMMLPIYLKEISEYSLAVESAPKRTLELRKEPILEWTNPSRSTLQQGVIFLWLNDGRPAALGGIFSQQDPSLPGRRIIHELHALDVEKLSVRRPNTLNEWKPQAGLERKQLADAGVPAPTPGGRLVQMRKLAQEFTAHETDTEGKRCDLRLIPAPRFRYPFAKSGVIDGALFTFLSNEGTDPEVWLLFEAREKDGKIRWEYACCRFSNRDLYVQRKGKEVWSSVRNKNDTVLHDPQHLYRLFADKVITLEGKVLARVRETPEVWWGEAVPVDEK